MVNYANGKIYMIERIGGSDEGCVYIGSTTKKYLSQRMESHLHDFEGWVLGCRNYKKITSFNVFKKYGVKNCHIVLLETCPCNSVEELRAIEATHIRSTPCVNKCIPGRTKQAYREEHKQLLNQKGQEYYHANVEAIKKRKTTPTLCECGCSVSRCGMAKHIRTQKHISAMNSLSAVLPDSNRDLR